MLKASFTKNMDDGGEKDFNKIIHHVKLIMWDKVGIIRNKRFRKGEKNRWEKGENERRSAGKRSPL